MVAVLRYFRDTGSSNLGIRKDTASSSHPAPQFYDVLDECCPAHAGWNRRQLVDSNIDQASCFNRLLAECQSYSDRLEELGALRNMGAFLRTTRCSGAQPSPHLGKKGEVLPFQDPGKLLPQGT